jgi:hypothetical protein
MDHRDIQRINDKSTALSRMILGDLEKGNGWLYRNKTPKANPLDATNFFPAQRIPPESALQGKHPHTPTALHGK